MSIGAALQVGQRAKDDILDLQQASNDELRYSEAERKQIKDVLRMLAKLAHPEEENPTDEDETKAFFPSK
jgi:hypothetical protein